jgi:membrane protease YdiL (CAAX protease family)
MEIDGYAMKAYATIYEGEFGIERWILKAGFWGQIFRMFLIENAFTIPMSIIFTIINIKNMDGFVNAPDFSALPLFVTVVLIVFIIPVLETLVFQKIIIDGINRFRFIKNRWIAIIVSALIFSSLHYYSIWYVFLILPTGLIMAIMYDGLKRAGDHITHIRPPVVKTRK